MAVNDRCSVPGDECSEPGGKMGRGMCGKHYQRWVAANPDRSTWPPPPRIQPSVCSINDEDCSEPGGKIRRGLCEKHYKRQQIHGSTSRDALKFIRPPNGAPQAFLDMAVAYEGDDCLEWPYGRSRNGYGRAYVKVNGVTRAVQAHRYVLSLVTGVSLDVRLDAAHTPKICHNRACCNPKHLRWATRSQNWRDMEADDVDPRGERSHLAKLSEADVVQIIDALKKGESTADLAARFSVTNGSIKNILIGHTWKHLPRPWLSDDPADDEAAA